MGNFDENRKQFEAGAEPSQSLVADTLNGQTSQNLSVDTSWQVGRILESITDAFVALDRDWRFVYVNREASRLLRRSREELLGKVLWRDVMRSTTGTEAEQRLRAAVAEQQTVVFDQYIPQLRCWFELRANPSPDGLSVYFRDITAARSEEGVRRQQERQIQENQRLLQQVTDTTPGILYVYNLVQQRNVYVNRQISRILGYTPEQIRDMGTSLFAQLVHPEDLATFPEHILQFNTLADGEVLEKEYRMRNVQGEWRWFAGRDTVFNRTDDGTPREILGSAYDVTERKQTERDLRREKERFELATSAVNCLIYDWNPLTQTVQRSEGLTRIFGYSPDEAAPTPDWWFDCIHPDDLAPTREQINAALAEGNRYSIEYRVRRKDGRYVYVLDQGIAVRNGVGEVVRVVGSSTDISDRKKMERQQQFLLELNDTLRLLDNPEEIMDAVVSAIGNYCEVTRCAYAEVDPDPEYVKIQRDFCWGTASVVGRYAIRYFGAAIVEDLRQGKTVTITDVHSDPRTCNQRWVYDSIHTRSALAVPLIKQGRFVAALTLQQEQPRQWSTDEIELLEQVTDLTWLAVERARSEAERERLLAQSQQYAAQLRGLTNASLAINSARSVEQVLQVITDQAHTIIGTHQCVTSLVTHQNWAEATHATHLSEKYAAWHSYSATPTGAGIYQYLLQLKRPMRMTQAELEAHPQWRGFSEEAAHHPPMRGWLAAPLLERNGQCIGLIQLSDKYEGEFTESDEDILVQLAQTASVAIENTRLYEAEQSARTQAEAANRIKDEFLAVLSHELRSPLNPILGWAGMLRTRKLDSNMTAQALETIERNARLQTQLIDDLLDVSRILRGKLNLKVSPVNLASIVEAAIETVRLAAEAKSIQIQTHYELEGRLVSGDSNRLQQVVWNLLSNAVKFTPDGGKVTIWLQPVGHGEAGQGDRSVPASQSPASTPHSPLYAQITVTDTGKGIDPDFLPYIFDYFRQEDSATTRKFGGLGLGLAIARHLIELHGGTIAALSRGEGTGATFIVQLPLLKELPIVRANGSPGVDTGSAPARLLKDRRVLIVDDDPDTRELITFVLQQAGATVQAADCAVAALSALTETEVDLLVSDIGMPEMDGYMLMQQLRSRFQQQTVVDKPRSMPRAIALTAYASESDQRQALSVGFERHLTKPINPTELVAAVSELLSDQTMG